MRRRSVVLWLVPLVTLAALFAFTLQRRTAQPPFQPAYWPTRTWQTTTPKAQGIDSTRLAIALLTMREKQINIHSLLIVRNGYAVVDATFYPYDEAAVHDVASVTKSVITTLIGIAADQGKLGLDQPMVSFFSNRPIANRDPRKERITGMSSGWTAHTREGRGDAARDAGQPGLGAVCA